MVKEFCSTSPERRAGVALVPITHGVDEAVKEVEALAGKPGIKGVMIPTLWHDAPPYGTDHYDNWAAWRSWVSHTPIPEKQISQATGRT